MSYRSIRSAQVQATLARLATAQAPVTDFVNRQIAILERDPVSVSRPAFSLLPAGQLFQFDFVFQGMTYQFDLIFRYGADEETLHLENLFLETV